MDIFSNDEKLVKALNGITRQLSDIDKALHELTHEVRKCGANAEKLTDILQKSQLPEATQAAFYPIRIVTGLSQDEGGSE